ncbi:MAG: TIGR00282 family metallophosphoesterase, partial [Verrucomicrobiae bacterium]|nr:TIGR00282 family metallophosphoesterase [Verrucomicrobiae bacterium]
SVLPGLRQTRELDLVIANGENSAHGAGLTAATVAELQAAGVDVVTAGDHVWDQKEFETQIATLDRVIRPLNYPDGAPGRGSVTVCARDETPVAVINALGRVYMHPHVDCPFRSLEAEVTRLRQLTPIIVVDFHAEATSEKIALARFLDGRVTAVLGTHTHVPTADERILPGGTAFISDVGMTGPYDSVLGREANAVIRRFTTQMPQKMEVATGDVRFCAVLIELDAASGRAQNIERIQLPVPDAS